MINRLKAVVTSGAEEKCGSPFAASHGIPCFFGFLYAMIYDGDIHGERLLGF
jgi:hypothetical protein